MFSIQQQQQKLEDLQRNKALPIIRKKSISRNCHWVIPDVACGTQKLQNSYYRYFKEIKGTMYKELKESMMIMTQWMENSVNYKREQNRIEKCNN